MKTLSLNTKHCISFAAIRLQGAIWSSAVVKYGPMTELGDRMQEVRG